MSIHEQYPPPPDFVSDNCTIPWFLFFLRPFMWGFEDACRWHDWARRHLVHHKIMTVKESDWAWRAYMKGIVARRAWLYRVTLGRIIPNLAWVFVKLSRQHYSRTLPVKPEWESYLNPVEPDDNHPRR